jgi:hypothetical protein
MKYLSRVLVTCGSALYLLAMPVWSDDADSANQQEDEWLDTSHTYVVQRADNIAEWMNNFFGDVRAEEEAPYSTLRLRFEQEWDEVDKFDSDVKLRGKVYLPQLNERISLLFSDEDTGKTGRDDLLIDDKDRPDDVTLQVRATETDRSRVDFRLGIRSSGHPKASVRYKYDHPISDKLIGTYSEELLYLGDDGFSARTRVEFDRILREDLLLQWHNRTDWWEELSGLTWDTSLSLDKKLSDKKVIGTFIGANGRTKPDNRVDNYQIGLRYRQNIFREWLFFEMQPSYRWSKFYPERQRETAVVVLFRLEAVFHKDFAK